MARGRRLKSYLDYENALGDGIGVGYGQSGDAANLLI